MARNFCRAHRILLGRIGLNVGTRTIAGHELAAGDPKSIKTTSIVVGQHDIRRLKSHNDTMSGMNDLQRLAYLDWRSWACIGLPERILHSLSQACARKILQCEIQIIGGYAEIQDAAMER